MKVSIIIPIYNVSAYIERCIKSVMSQTYCGDIECILVDDASPDDSIDIAKRLVADYNGPIQFRILNHEQNRGLSATRNTGIEASTGDYLYFFDSDDEITPDCIEKLAHPILKDPTIEMVEGCYTTITTDGNNDVVEILHPRSQLEFASRESVRNFFFSRQNEEKHAWNKLVNRMFVLNNQLYFKGGHMWEDLLWHFCYNKYLNHLYIISDVTYKHYVRFNSIATTSIKDVNQLLGLFYAAIVNNLTPNDSVREVKYVLKDFCLLYLGSSTDPIYKQAAVYFLKVLKENHCFKEWLFLKSIIFFSKFTLIRNALKNVGDFLKNFLEGSNLHENDKNLRSPPLLQCGKIHSPWFGFYHCTDFARMGSDFGR